MIYMKQQEPISREFNGNSRLSPKRVAVALGSNLNDRLENIQQARNLLSELGTDFLHSQIFETEPVKCPIDLQFLNCATAFTTTLKPLTLLKRLQEIENALGRKRSVPNAPRTMDLDLLIYGKALLQTKTLMLPHPRLHKRLFVLVPLMEIWEDHFILPGHNLTLAAYRDLLLNEGNEPPPRPFPK
ncbi:MAG: 2-amino-4-hydroxy-6-hydroxymethyldihydropteridine diphosphokinase [Acidobacteria bacterium]|nr:MAG: 2-amino-4-hydroxy-6-hydroxymethyldihydropteridine diphosphokinase [Acidobacteriota bacterium]